GLRGENLLGEMLGGIRLWRAEPRLDAALCCRQRLATTPAELLAALIQKSTRRARRRERQPAFTAEAASLSVLHCASRTDYQRSSPSSFSAFSNQYVMPISRHIVVAVVRCSRACSRWPVRRYSLPRPRWYLVASVSSARLYRALPGGVGNLGLPA